MLIFFLETLHFAEKIFLLKNFIQQQWNWLWVLSSWLQTQQLTTNGILKCLFLHLRHFHWFDKEKKMSVTPFPPVTWSHQQGRTGNAPWILQADLQTWNKRPLQEVIINDSKESGQILTSSPALESPARQQQAGEGQLFSSFGFSNPQSLVSAEELSLMKQSFTEVLPAGLRGQSMEQSNGLWLKHRHGVCNVLQALIKNPSKISCSHPLAHTLPLPPQRQSVTLCKLACWREVNLALVLSIDYLSSGWGL